MGEGGAKRHAPSTLLPLYRPSRTLFSRRSREACMTHSETRDFGAYNDVRPHVFDPAVNPELFEGVLARRVIAFVIDVIVITVPVIFAAMFILVFGVLTLGLGLLLFLIFGPAAMIWALVYCGMTLGRPASATL